MDQEQIDNLLAEKIALDQMYMSSIKELHECKKQLILKDESVRKLIQQCQEKLEEIEKLKEKVKDLEPSNDLNEDEVILS